MSILDKLADYDQAVTKQARALFENGHAQDAARRALAKAELERIALYANGEPAESEQARVIGDLNKLRNRMVDREGTPYDARLLAEAAKITRLRKEAEQERLDFIRRHAEQITAELLVEAEAARAMQNDLLKAADAATAAWKANQSKWLAVSPGLGDERPSFRHRPPSEDAAQILTMELRRGTDLPAPGSVQAAIAAEDEAVAVGQ